MRAEVVVTNPVFTLNEPGAPPATASDLVVRVEARMSSGWTVAGTYRHRGGDLQLEHVSVSKGGARSVNAATLRMVPIKLMHECAWAEMERAARDGTATARTSPRGT